MFSYSNNLFITKADDKVPENVITSLTKRIEKLSGKVVDSISFTTKMDSAIDPEIVKEDLAEWIKKLNI